MKNSLIQSAKLDLLKEKEKLSILSSFLMSPRNNQRINQRKKNKKKKCSSKKDRKK
jgi:hypothetical protein